MSKWLHILQHSLGLDKYGKGRQYRNHFCTGIGSTDYPGCQLLVSMGFMTEHSGSELSGGDSIFCVTQAGIEYVVRHSLEEAK